MKNFDLGSIIIIVITFVLFVMALFYTGLTHDILLETAVFLVSVKLIIMSYKTNKSSKILESEVKEIKLLLKQSMDKHDKSVP